jgi:hypothetical protein
MKGSLTFMIPGWNRAEYHYQLILSLNGNIGSPMALHNRENVACLRCSKFKSSKAKYSDMCTKNSLTELSVFTGIVTVPQ